MIRQWHVYEADFEPTVGHEQRGRRPALVVSSDEINDTNWLIVVVPLTTRKSERPVYSGEALIPRGVGGTRAESIALVHQVRALDPGRLGAYMGSVDDAAIRAKVKDAVWDVFDGCI